MSAFLCTIAEWKGVSATVPGKTLGQDFWAAETFGADRDGVVKIEPPQKKNLTQKGAQPHLKVKL